MTRYCLLAILFTSIQVQPADSSVKTWVGRAEWGQTTNWINGLPGGCDSALIETNQILGIAAQANIAEISFSGESAVVFDSFSEVAFGQGTYCSDKESGVKYFQSGRSDFLSVSNWEEEREFEMIGAIDIHKIPCSYDIAEIPRGEMRAELRAPVTVGAVKYGGELLSRGQLHDWMNSPDGRNELRVLSSFTVSDVSYCKSRGGCECGNEASCNETVCSSKLPCLNPVSSPVMCCEYCGSLIRVPVNYQESYRQLELDLSSVLAHQPHPQLLKMGILDGILYMVLEEKASVSVPGIDIADVIIQRLVQTNYSSALNIKVVRSSSINPEAVHQSPVPTNTVLLIVLSAVVITLVICGFVLLLMIRKKNKKLSQSRQNRPPNIAARNIYSTLDRHVYETVHGRMRSAESVVPKQPKKPDYYSSLPEYHPDQFPDYHPTELHHPAGGLHQPDQFKMTSLHKSPTSSLHDALYYHGASDVLEQSLLKYYENKERGLGYHGNQDNSIRQLTAI